MELIHAHEEEVQIELSAVPVSIQAKKESRDRVSGEIRALVSNIPFLFSGDIRSHHPVVASGATALRKRPDC